MDLSYLLNFYLIQLSLNLFCPKLPIELGSSTEYQNNGPYNSLP